jgi:site-specific recombinase XerD
MRALLAQCGRGLAGKRNMAMIVVMWRAGLRCGEVLDMQRSDVDIQAAAIRIRHGKGDRARTVGIDRQALTIIEQWSERRTYLPHYRSGPLFCTISTPNAGSPLQSAYVRTMIRRLAHKAGIDHRVHPHALRHTYAVECAREGIAPELLRRQLGHASLHTTTRYLQGIAAADVVETMNRREWPEP